MLNTRRLLGVVILGLISASCSKQQSVSDHESAAPDQSRFNDSPASPPTKSGLADYVGSNLRELDETAAEDFRKRVRALTGDEPEERALSSFRPWWVQPFIVGEARWLFLEAYPGFNIPDVSAVRIHVFDERWKRLGKQSFPTGYRFFLNDAFIARENPLGVELVVAKATSSGPFIVQGDEKHPAFEQGDFQLQYYGLLGNQFVMVRLEDNDGRLARNNYRWSAPPKGPAVPKRTAEQWIRTLRSESPVELLATLVWLSGEHLASSEERHANVNQESVEDSTVFESVRDSSDTKNALNSLARSKHTWVKEYAKLAGGRD